MFDVLEHAGLQQPVFFHGDGDDPVGEPALYTAFFEIEQPNDVLALDGSKGYAGGMAYINAFFDQVLGCLLYTSRCV